MHPKNDRDVRNAAPVSRYRLAPRPIWLHDGMPYPLVIFLTRYGGTYEGGQWAALNREEIPPEATADDVTCSEFWGDVEANAGVVMDKYGEVCFGVGHTPDEAIKHCTETAKAYNAKLEATRAAE